MYIGVSSVYRSTSIYAGCVKKSAHHRRGEGPLSEITHPSNSLAKRYILYVTEKMHKKIAQSELKS